MAIVVVVVVVVDPFLGFAYIASKWAGRVSVFFPFSSFFGSCSFFLFASFLSPTFVEQTNIAGPIKAQIMEPTHLAPDGGEPKADTEDVDTDGGASRRQES